MPSELLTTAEACTYLRIGRVTLWKLVTAGRIDVIRRNSRCNLYTREALDAYIADLDYDEAAVLKATVERIAERQAEEQRPLCPSCGKRRVNRGASMCLWCEQQHEAQLEHKRKWWNAHGQENRRARREAETAAS